jgi:hypothetical protein
MCGKEHDMTLESVVEILERANVVFALLHRYWAIELGVQIMLTQYPSKTADQKSLILSLARAEIGSTFFCDAEGITCSMNEDILILTGQVPSYYHKQLAQSRLIAKFEGLVPLENRIIVRYPQ